MTLRNHVAIVVADIAFTEVVEDLVIARQVHRCRVHEVLEGVSLVGHHPLVLGLGGIARDADINIGSLIRCFAGELGEHAIVADIDCKLGTLGAIAYRHAQVTWVPRLDGGPWLQLAVVQRNLAIGVDDNRRVERGLPLFVVGFHDGEDAPDVIVLTSLLVLVHLGVIEPDEEFIVGPNLGVQS